MEHLNHWSHQICGNVWKYRKIADGGKIWVIEAPQYFAAAEYLTIFENTTRLSETEKILFIEATKYLAMFENTTELEATGGKIKLLKPPNVWKYHKIAGHGVKFKLI